MKKNVMMRIASTTAVLVMLTTCIVSGTYAKYTTAADASDSARVAKFGVEISATGNLFDTEYDTDDTGTFINITDKSVISSDDDNVVAPGTKGETIGLSITGKPEVAVKVEYVVNTFSLTNWEVKDGSDDVEYCPIIFTIAGDTYGMTGIKDSNGDEADNTYATVAALETGIKEALESASDYAPNTDLSASDSITWEWAFEGNNDAYDTQLGDIAADDIDSAATIELDITVSVTQVD